MLIARKNKDTGEIEYTGGTAVDEELSIESPNPVQNKVVTSKFSEVSEEINALKKSVSDGKTTVANAITGQGVTTATDATFATMAENVGTVGTNKYNAGVNATKVGTAGAGDVLSGKTFTNGSSVGATGTMPDRSSAIHTAVSDTTDKNKSIFRTNGTNVEVIPAVGYWGTWDWSKEKILIPASSLGITANKILKGNTICGVAGTAEGGVEVHGSSIIVTLNSDVVVGSVLSIYLDGTIVSQITMQSTTYTYIAQYKGTYTFTYQGCSNIDVVISADDILGKNTKAITLRKEYYLYDNGASYVEFKQAFCTMNGSFSIEANYLKLYCPMSNSYGSSLAQFMTKNSIDITNFQKLTFIGTSNMGSGGTYEQLYLGVANSNIETNSPWDNGAAVSHITTKDKSFAITLDITSISGAKHIYGCLNAGTYAGVYAYIKKIYLG